MLPLVSWGLFSVASRAGEGGSPFMCSNDAAMCGMIVECGATKHTMLWCVQEYEAYDAAMYTNYTTV